MNTPDDTADALGKFVRDLLGRGEPTRTQWEYKVLAMHDWHPWRGLQNTPERRGRETYQAEKLEQLLNSLGEQGWELIQRDEDVYYFKRVRR